MEMGAPVLTSRRGLRDWAVDAVLFAFAVAFWALTMGVRLQQPGPIEPAWLFALEATTGAAGCAAVWMRRRRPVSVALALAAVGVISEAAAVALLAALFTVAVRRPLRTTVLVWAVSLAAPLSHLVFPAEPGASSLAGFLVGFIVLSGTAGWGLFARQRRQLLSSLRDRAVRAENEARLRAEQSQLRAREALAREMHDVLGHRLSLLSVHAGALKFRPDAPAEDIARAAEVIRESAHRALQDLREVVGVLRAPVGELARPGLAEVESLTDESGLAGMDVALVDEVGAPVPEGIGRTAYRVVQEGLTNARKYAPGAEVRVRLEGEPGRELTVEVSNTAPAPAAAVPSTAAGHGLAGLAERVAEAGGSLESGAVGDGGWRLAARLPWPP